MRGETTAKYRDDEMRTGFFQIYPWYYVTVTGKSEHYEINGKVVKRRLGSLLLACLEIGWEEMQKEALQLRKDHQYDVDQSKVFAEWYLEKKKNLTAMNPLLEVLFSDCLPTKFRAHLNERGNPENSANRKYVDNLAKGDVAEGLCNELRRDFLMKVAEEFVNIRKALLMLSPFVNALCVKEGDPEVNLLKQYYRFRKADSSNYGIMDRDYYPRLGSQTRLSEGKNGSISIQTYWFSDNLGAVLLLLCDKMVTNKVYLRRCRHCGELFVPTTSTSCYCDKIALGENKSCKKLAPAVVYKKTLEEDMAKKLMGTVRNRYINFMADNCKENGEEEKANLEKMQEIYKAWKTEAKKKYNSFNNNDISYEEFEAAINIKSKILFEEVVCKEKKSAITNEGIEIKDTEMEKEEYISIPTQYEMMSKTRKN